jgi:hypothetical protein
MAGDRPTDSATAPQAESSGLFAHTFMDKIKHGATAVRDTTLGVVRQGVEKGQEIAHHQTTQKLVGEVTDAGRKAVHARQEVVHNPTTQRVAGQVVEAGKEVGRDHARQAMGLVDAGRRGDVTGVIHHGLPLASEVLMGPLPAAAMLAKEKGGKILMENLSPEQRETATKLQGAAEIATTPVSQLPNLILHGKY